MGTDINCYAEVRQKNGQWQPTFGNSLAADPRKTEGEPAWVNPEKVAYYKMSDHEYLSLPETERLELSAGKFGLGRDYAAFAVLANVKSGDDSFPVIAMPRGLPSDVSSPVKTLLQKDSCMHSHSWCTLGELLAFDWDQPIEKGTPLREFLSPRLFNVIGRLKQLGQPEEVRLVFAFN